MVRLAVRPTDIQVSRCVCVCVCGCVCMCTCTCMCVYLYVWVCVCMCMYNVCVSIYASLSLPRIAIEAMRSLPPGVITMALNNALWSREEEIVLAKILSVSAIACKKLNTDHYTHTHPKSFLNCFCPPLGDFPK